MNGVSKVLKKQEIRGSGGTMGTEPYYYLKFNEDEDIIKAWDEEFEEVPVGGKRKSRLNRKTRRKSRKNRRKSNNRRRH